jgi:predicted MPP superfamily phosphohydrolase
MNRRRFLGLCAAGGVAAAGAWTVHDIHSERFSLRVNRRRLRVPGLPAPLEGLKIALLSDFHAGWCTPWNLATRAAALATAEKPDLTFLLGDYISDPVASVGAPLRKVLAAMRAQHGVWAVLGNHDWMYGRHRPVLAGLAATGATLLRNSARRLSIRGEDLWLAGLDDPVTERDNFEAALRHVPAGALTFLLTHTPDVIYQAAQLGLRAVFAGHTHGGQVCIPFYGPPIVPSKFGKRFAAGAFNVNGTSLYVTRGIGSVPPLVRFNCPPEVSILTLAAAKT